MYGKVTILASIEQSVRFYAFFLLFEFCGIIRNGQVLSGMNTCIAQGIDKAYLIDVVLYGIIFFGHVVCRNTPERITRLHGNALIIFERFRSLGIDCLSLGQNTAEGNTAQKSNEQCKRKEKQNPVQLEGTLSSLPGYIVPMRSVQSGGRGNLLTVRHVSLRIKLPSGGIVTIPARHMGLWIIINVLLLAEI